MSLESNDARKSWSCGIDGWKPGIYDVELLHVLCVLIRKSKLFILYSLDALFSQLFHVTAITWAVVRDFLFVISHYQFTWWPFEYFIN